jgi:hypothetical protein
VRRILFLMDDHLDQDWYSEYWICARAYDVQPHPVDRLHALPKAEVHAHLEGGFEPDLLEQWATQARVRVPRPRERLFEFEGLASTRERLAELSYGYSKRLAEGGVSINTDDTVLLGAGLVGE